MSFPSTIVHQYVENNGSNAFGFKKVGTTIAHHIRKHLGVGIICAVAYFDPGNWSVDLQAGSQFGYKLLFVVLLSGLGAVVLQTLSCKLGCVTGLDLASHCRLLLYDHPTYPKLIRRVFLYPLYVLSEIAIVSTDIAELLGSAIGLNLIFPSLPLWAAVILTAFDVLFILAVGDQSKGHNRPVRIFELVIIVLVAIVLICFIILIIKVNPTWNSVFDGFAPSKTLVQPQGLYASIGILGATVMPHALYLGSHLATQDRVGATLNPTSLPDLRERRSVVKSFRSSMKGLFSVGCANRGDADCRDRHTPYGERKNSSIKFVRAHLGHGIADIALSLLGFALAINSAILILAGAVFFYGKDRMTADSAAGLSDAYNLIKASVGKAPAFIFALALICSGQSASITATLAGQIVSEGFINWSIPPFTRRLVTRLLGLVPSVAVAVAVGKEGINTLLVLTQVILSLVLPFVVFPLVWLTSSTLVMRVQKPVLQPTMPDNSNASDLTPSDIATDVVTIEAIIVNEVNETLANAEKEKVVPVRELVLETDSTFVDYSNGWVLTIISYAIWLFVLVANGYLIVTLALGQSK